jgi:hypothetical protein
MFWKKSAIDFGIHGLHLKWSEKPLLDQKIWWKRFLIVKRTYARHPLSERSWRCSCGKETREHGRWCLDHSE